MRKQIPEEVGVSREARKEFLFAEARAYQEKHNVRWSEACRQVVKMYGDVAYIAFGGNPLGNQQQ